MKIVLRNTMCVMLSFTIWHFASQFVSADNWPQFRGPDGQGHAKATNLPLEWSESKNVAWKRELPGRGWSSPVIEDDFIWMTAAVETKVSEAEKKKRLEGNTGSQPLNVSGDLSLRALCVQKQTGELLHDIELMVQQEPQPVHVLNSFASPTPVIENGRLYCHYGTYGTACLDTKTGKVLWTNRDLKINHENGPGSSPVLWKNYLIIHCDGSDLQYIVALSKETGKIAWKTDRTGKMNANPQLKKAYGTPLVIQQNGKDIVVSPGADWLYGYDPQTGNELWKMNYGVLGFSIVPRPVEGKGRVYFCTSFLRSELLAVEFDSDQKPKIAWRYNRQVSQMPSPLLVGNEIYVVSDKGGIVSCLNAETGKLNWQHRLGGNFSASPLYADGKIFFFDRTGTCTIISPSKSGFEELASNKLQGSFMASAAAIDSALYLRTDSALYRIEKPK